MTFSIIHTQLTQKWGEKSRYREDLSNLECITGRDKTAYSKWINLARLLDVIKFLNIIMKYDETVL